MNSRVSQTDHFDADPVSDRVVELYRPGKRACSIGKRDSWICGICQLPIDPDYWRSRLGPRFDSLRPQLKPEIEHIIPREWGGSDTDNNLQIAHAACNRTKHTDPQLSVEDARHYLTWRLGLAVDPFSRLGRLPRAPGGSQRAALEAAVERGEPGPMYFYAAALRRQDPERSERLFRRAAELGYVPPRRALFLLHGRRDLASLFRDNQRVALEAAVERGEPLPMLDLATSLGKDDPERSEQLFRRAAELGNDEALVELGLLLKEGDPQRATELFQDAAQRGSLKGMYHLGLMLYRSDKEVGLSWLKRAVAESSVLAERDRRARRRVDQSRRGVTLRALLDDFEPEKVTVVLRELVERDSLEAMYYLGLMLYPADKELGLCWLKRAAERGLRQASGLLALTEKQGDDPLMTQAEWLWSRPGVSAAKADAQPQVQKPISPHDRSPDQPDQTLTLRADTDHGRSRKVSDGRRSMLPYLRKRVRRWWG